jgi:hypothetical protein
VLCRCRMQLHCDGECERCARVLSSKEGHCSSPIREFERRGFMLSHSKSNQMAASNPTAKAPEAHFSAGGTGAGIYFKAPPVFCAPPVQKEDPAIDTSNLTATSLRLLQAFERPLTPFSGQERIIKTVRCLRCSRVIDPMDASERTSTACKFHPGPSKTSLRVYNAYDKVLYLCCNRVPKGWCPVIEEADTCSQAAHDFGGVVLPPLQ